MKSITCFLKTKVLSMLLCKFIVPENICMLLETAIIKVHSKHQNVLAVRNHT